MCRLIHLAINKNGNQPNQTTLYKKGWKEPQAITVNELVVDCREGTSKNHIIFFVKICMMINDKIAGPASTVEERLLRNIPSEWTVVRSSPWICLFRRNLFFSRKNALHIGLTETSNIRTGQSVHATSISEKAVAQPTTV